MTYEESKRFVFRGLGLLAAITLVEVFFSLASKGFIPGLRWMDGVSWIPYLVGALLIGFSLYKAHFIVFDFMHMRSEVQGLSLTVLMPMLLLVWAVIAFFQEGNFWGERRAVVQRFNELPAQAAPTVSPLEQGSTIEIKPADGELLDDGEGVGSYDVDQ